MVRSLQYDGVLGPLLSWYYRSFVGREDDMRRRSSIGIVWAYIFSYFYLVFYTMALTLRCVQRCDDALDGQDFVYPDKRLGAYHTGLSRVKN